MSNKVKLVAGQFWNVNGFTLKVRHVDNELSIVRFSGGLLYSFSQVHRDFKFVPQNDLEHLAVQYDCWNCNRHLLIARSSDLKGICFVENNDDGLFKNTYTYSELQDMRYELGLDKNKREELTNGMIFYHLAPISEDFKKEIDVIDLSGAEVGDKFVLNNGTVVSFFARTKMNSICELDSGHAMVYFHNGEFDESVESNDNKSNWDIVSEYVSHKGLKKFDIVEVVTNPRQEEVNFATILELTTFEGEDSALIQYHHNTCGPDTVCVCYMTKHEKETT